MKIYAVRHGETEINNKGMINGRNTIGLNPKGIMQAKKAGLKLTNIDFDIIYSSPLPRAMQTTKCLNYNGYNVIYDDRLMERDAGSMQYKHVGDIDVELWYDRTKLVIYDDTEGFKNIINRTKDFLNDLVSSCEYENVLIVTHNDVLKALYVIFNKNTTDDMILRYEVKNCAIAEYIVDENQEL